MVYVERLLDEPWSRWRAKKISTEHWQEHLGWGLQQYMTAALIDAVNINSAITAASGSGKAPKKPKPVPLPQTGKKKPRSPKAIEPGARVLTDNEVAQLSAAEIEAALND